MKLNELIAWYTTLKPDTVERVGEFYREDARFRDPFNDVTGQAAIAAIFHHMFNTTDRPRFHVTDYQCEGKTAWISWDFRCGLQGRSITIEGSSRLDFTDDGRVSSHRDYWDATDLFAQLPLIGTMMKVIKNRMHQPDGSTKGERNA